MAKTGIFSVFINLEKIFFFLLKKIDATVDTIFELYDEYNKKILPQRFEPKNDKVIHFFYIPCCVRSTIIFIK